MRWVAVAVPVILAFLGTPSVAAEEAPPSWHAKVIAHSESGLNVTYFWSKGPKLRAETVVSGHRIVTIVSGKLYYAYDAVAGKGIAVQRAPEAIAQDRPERRPFGRELEILEAQGAEKVREETHHGAPCDVFRVTDNAGRRELWVTQAPPQLPVRLSIYSRKSGQTRYSDYLNWLSGLPLPDAFFEPEPSVELERYAFEDYVRITVEQGPVGPVPILYADLLHGGR
jgi:hypothetical protein